MILSLFLILFISFSYADDYLLDAIEVTSIKSNKDERSFLESTESVSVLKSKNLNRSDIQNSIQMLNGFANVQTQSNKSGETFSIRGISDMGVTGYQKDNLASILVDDIFQTTLAVRAGSFENWDLERVEILRGAQSTSQGVNSLAGNILLYHNAPVFEKQGAAKFAVGNFGRKEAAVTINKPVNDKLALRLSYNKEMQDGFIRNKATDNEKWNARNKDHLRGDLLYRLSKGEELRLNVKFLRMNRGGSYVQGDFEDYEVRENQDYKEITNNQQVGLIYTKIFSPSLSNKLILGASRADSQTKSDEDGTSPEHSPSTLQAGTRIGSDKDQFLSLENQLKYKSDKVRNVLGIHLHRYYLRNQYDMNLKFTASQSYPVVQENEKYRNTFALFDSFTYSFTKHHALNLGGRFEVTENRFGADIEIPSSSPYGALAGKHEDTSTNSVFLPKMGYTYLNGNYSLGVNYNQGYRTGGVSVNRWKATTNSYDPEKTHNYELSYKYAENRMIFAANAFYTKWKDQQVELILSNTFDTEVRNASESELYGAEFELTYLFKNNDSLRLNAGYVETQFLNFKNAGKDYTMNQFPDAANVTGQLSYWKPLNDKWNIVLVSRYVGDSYTDPENARSSPEQFYTDINTQYNWGQYILEFYVRNVFNQKYRLLDGSPRTASSPYQASYHRVSAPREFGTRLNYYW